MSDLIQKTLQRITTEHIHPEPAWRARVKNSAYWMGTSLLVVFAALAMALTLHALIEIDWDAYAKAHFSWGEIILSGAPLFSLFLLTLFLWFSAVLLRETRRGYRYPFGLLMTLFFSTSLIFGSFIERSPLDQPAERFLLHTLPREAPVRALLFPSVERQWSQPERGLLGGSVESADSKEIILRDTSEKLWTIEYTRSTINDGVSLDPNQELKVIGVKDGDDVFRATEVRTWEQVPKEDRQKNDSNDSGMKIQEKKHPATADEELDEADEDARERESEDSVESDVETDEDHE